MFHIALLIFPRGAVESYCREPGGFKTSALVEAVARPIKLTYMLGWRRREENPEEAHAMGERAIPTRKGPGPLAVDHRGRKNKDSS